MIDETRQQDNAKVRKGHRHTQLHDYEDELLTRLQRSELLVYIHIKRSCWTHGSTTDITNAQFSQKTGINDRSVSRSISRLVELGVITCESRIELASGKAKTSRVITLVSTKTQVSTTIDTGVVAHLTQASTPNRHACLPPIDTGVVLLIKDLNKEAEEAAEEREEEKTGIVEVPPISPTTPEVEETPLPEGNFSMTSQEEISRDLDELFGPPAQAPPEIQVEPATTTEPEISDAVIEAQKRLDKAKGVTGRRYVKSKPKISLTPEMQLDIANRFSPEAIARRQAEKNATIFLGNSMLSH